MKKKILAVLLAALMLAPTITSCSDNATTSSETTENDTTVLSVEEETEAGSDDIDSRASISDDLPEADYGGQEFRVLTTEGRRDLWL